MARIQVLARPTEGLGQSETAPFAIVVDGIDGDDSHQIEELVRFAEKIGARGTLLSELPLDVA